VQRTLPHNWFVRTTYVGQKGTHLVGPPNWNMNVLPQGAPQKYGSLLSQNINSGAATAAGITAPFSNFAQLLGSNATVAQALKPYPQYLNIYKRFPYTGGMKYASWQTEIDKRYSGGFSLLSGFTLQRDISNATSMLEWDGVSIYPADPYNPSTTYAPVGPFWLVNIAGTYDLPVGSGKRWFNNKHITGEVLGGWKVAWSQYYGSGSPHGVGANGSPYGNGNRADRVPGLPIKVNGYGAVKKWILAGANPAALPVVIQNNGAFVSPGEQSGVSAAASQYIPGDSKAAYSEFRDPTYMVENIGAMKEFAMFERAKGILRVDYFNPFNRWYLGGCVDMNVLDGTFGEFTNPHCGSGQRTGQATFRIEF